MPAGAILVDGSFVAAHASELVQLIRNVVEHERNDHPLFRIMELVEGTAEVRVATTDIHLPQRIGSALKSAYDGELTIQYAGDDYAVRVHWHR